MSQRFLIVLGAMLVFGVVGFAPAAAQGTPVLEGTACPFPLPGSETEGDTVECGILIVPEDRTNANSPTIELAVALIYSTGTPLDEPLIYLEGGPGGSALAGVDSWWESPIREISDIVLIDQRGTGYSQPSLNCPELDDEESADPTVDCYNRLVSEGVNLAAFTSVENAADINDLAIALEADAVNLYGVSYGTRLALTVIRDHPERVNSAIIDAVFPPNVSGYDEQTLNGQRAFDTLFDTCAADAECNSAFPNLREVFYDVVDEFNNQPAEIEDPESGELTELTGNDFVNNLFQQLYSSASIPTLPRIIYEAQDGEFETFIFGPEEAADGDEAEAGGPEIDIDALSDEEFNAALMAYLEIDDEDELFELLDSLDDDAYNALVEEAFLGGGGGGGPDIDDDSEGMFASVECYEEVPFNSVAGAEALAVNAAPQIREAMLEGVLQQFDDCAVWQVPTAPAFENDAVVSDIPTLVLSGQFDPITPPGWGEVAAAGLSNSYHYVFPGVGHGAIDGGDCPVSIILAFLGAPGSEPDGGCIAAMDVDFLLPGE